MGRKPVEKYISPTAGNTTVYGLKESPQALDRSQATLSQIWQSEGIIIWGENNDLPMRILDAVNNSPTTISCLDSVETFLKGAKFTDPGLMTMPIDKDGTTLWELHSQLCHNFTMLESYSTRFTFDSQGRITNTYSLGPETNRFMAPKIQKSKRITEIKYNPYWGTSDFKQDYSQIYPVWDPSQIKNQINEKGSSYLGQIYFYGSLRAPYKFYSVPKYWTGKHWIYTDAAIALFHHNNTDNGFFQSMLMTMIGDPNQKSKNPKYQKEVEGTDGTKRKEPTKTVGEEFDDMMANQFSGVKKAGNAMVLWARNKEESPGVVAFPANQQFDVLSGTLTDTIRGITISTRVQAILCNLPQAVNSLGSDGNSIQKSVELMQARVASGQNNLENFYNNVMIPNLQTKTAARVKLVNYRPISVSFDVPDKVWEWMNDKEKSSFLKKNFPDITIDEQRFTQQASVAPALDENGQPLPAAVIPQVNENIKGLTQKNINDLVSTVRKVDKGILTYEQAKQILMGYGLSEENIKAWLKEEPITV